MKIVGSFFFTAASETVEVSLPGVPWPPNTYESYMAAPIPVSFTAPSGNNPGTFEFNWQDVDANGVVHTGNSIRDMARSSNLRRKGMCVACPKAVDVLDYGQLTSGAKEPSSAGR